MTRRLDHWKQKAKQLKIETHALYLAYRDPRTPWYAKLFIGCVVGYALSPIDLIPDFIPVLGYLDDMILIPVGVTLALKMIPPGVLADCRDRARQEAEEKKSNHWLAAGLILIFWLLMSFLLIILVSKLWKFG